MKIGNLEPNTKPSTEIEKGNRGRSSLGVSVSVGIGVGVGVQWYHQAPSVSLWEYQFESLVWFKDFSARRHHHASGALSSKLQLMEARVKTLTIP